MRMTNKRTIRKILEKDGDRLWKRIYRPCESKNEEMQQKTGGLLRSNGSPRSLKNSQDVKKDIQTLRVKDRKNAAKNGEAIKEQWFSPKCKEFALQKLLYKRCKTVK